MFDFLFKKKESVSVRESVKTVKKKQRGVHMLLDEETSARLRAIEIPGRDKATLIAKLRYCVTLAQQVRDAQLLFPAIPQAALPVNEAPAEEAPAVRGRNFTSRRQYYVTTRGVTEFFETGTEAAKFLGLSQPGFATKIMKTEHRLMLHEDTRSTDWTFEHYDKKRRQNFSVKVVNP